jgi:hypothetical protein
VVRVPGYRTETYCVSCQVRTRPQRRSTFFYITYIEESRPPLWSSDQSFWLQIQRSWVRIPALPDFLRSGRSGTGCTHSVSTIEELLERKSSGSGLETENTSVGDLSRWPRDTLYPQKLVLSSPASGGHSIGTVRSQTKATEFSSNNKSWKRKCLSNRENYPKEHMKTQAYIPNPLVSSLWLII